MAIVLLYDSGNAVHQSAVIDFAKSLDGSDPFELDQYWMLLYQLFREGKIANPYPAEDAFTLMKTAGVNFLDGA